MEVHNIRSPKQWDIISRQIDFKGKKVLDMGCGKGDILASAKSAGADVIGIDIDKKNSHHIRSVYPGVPVLNDDLNHLELWKVKKDIIICFSVLPYLTWPEATLRWINQHSDIALIECQYAGDGPGFGFLTDNGAMHKWLLKYGGFEKADVIGFTLVEGRDTKRWIWICV